MAHYDANQVPYSVWFVVSGCSNHMTGMKEIFSDLDEAQRMIMRLGDNKKVQVEGKGIVAIKTIHGKVKVLENVQYVPSLVHNLLSVGQLISEGYSIIFDKETCRIKD